MEKSRAEERIALLTIIISFQDRNNADVELKLVEDAHDDYEFTGDELAHAPFPDSEYHGNVSQCLLRKS